MRKPFRVPPNREAEKREAQIDKMLAEYDLKPHPSPSIPDDPPPHEGAMISLPYVVEPPDLVLVEVLEPCPAGRSPESGWSGLMARSISAFTERFTSGG